MAEPSKQRDPLTRQIIGEAMYVHRVLGHGFLESIYHNALLLRLRKIGISIQSQASLAVYFEDEMIGNFLADLIFENRIIVELKAVSALTSVHEVQLVNYLTATKIDFGLLLNFGAPSLQFKRKFRTPSAKPELEPIYLHPPQSC